MASNHIDDEKPNLRPTKRSTANGKTLYLHHNPNPLSNNSYIRAIWNDTYKQQNEFSVDKQDPFGIQQPNVIYSLDKYQRWEMLNNFRQYLVNESNLSSSDDELNTQSDCEKQQQRTKKKSQRNYRIQHRTKYRLYEHHNIEHKNNCVEITTNSGQQRTQTPRKTYMPNLRDIKTKSKQTGEGIDADIEDNNDRIERTAIDVTYVTVVPPPREKYIGNIRKHHGSKSKKMISSLQRAKFTQIKEHLDSVEQLDEDKENLSTDDEEESIVSYYTCTRPGELQLNDFISIASTDDNNKRSSKSEESHTNDNLHMKPLPLYPDDSDSSRQDIHRFHRQITKEEKLSDQNTTESSKIQKTGKTIKSKEKSPTYFMSLSFRTISLHQTDFTIEHLSKVYGKNFIHAHCYPTKYLICLTDRLRSFQWPDRFNIFSLSMSFNCYLIIILDDHLNNEENICQGQVALNMDLNRETIDIENLSSSKQSIYTIEELINKAIEFLTNQSFDRFKAVETEINQRKYVKNDTESELSESEFINKQIRQVRKLDNKDLQSKFTIEDLNNDITTDEYNFIRPEICTNCCIDINELTPMTALKSCGHWLCNQCWKQYLENSIKAVKVILCPEWNCCAIVDIGTILSLVNVRYMNIYERHIEKCLVNLSRSYVKCPLKSCSNIVQIIGSGIDHVRCRCGHQFCYNCKEEPHFPATCSSYQAYIAEARRFGDLIADHDTKVLIKGRNCVSCHDFIEKNGGCNHMTCRCGAQFCWLCTGYWKDHYSSDGQFICPKPQITIQKKFIIKERNPSRRLYEHAIFHRHERTHQNQMKQNENCKRLIGTIPLDKQNSFDSSLIKSQIDKREALLRHCYEISKYINYLHRICEFVAVAGDGYANNPVEFSNSLYPLETLLFNISQILESGRGYAAIEQLNNVYKASEKFIERLRHAVSVRQIRRLHSTGYMTT